MRLTVVTPLFPPDVHDVASYHKKLVEKLVKDNQVQVVLFGHLPENVPGVLFTTIDKRMQVIVRLWRMFQTLIPFQRKSDWLIVTNGPSTELPVLLLSFFTRTPILLICSDIIHQSTVYKIIHTLLCRRVQSTITVSDSLSALTAPEIHPLITVSAETRTQYERTWQEHLANIRRHLTYDTDH